MRSIEPGNRHDRGTQGHLLSQRRGLLAALDVHPHRRHDSRLPRPAGYRRQVRNIEVVKGVATFAIMSALPGTTAPGSRCDRSPTGPCRWQMREASYDALLEWMANSTVARSNANASERSRMEDPTAAGSGNRNQITEWFVVAARVVGAKHTGCNPPNQDALQYLTKTPSATEGGPEPTEV